MCLIINRNIHPDLKPIKLRKDKVVWKCLLADTNKSLIMDFEYHRGWTYSVESMEFKGHSLTLIPFPIVRKAFHAYTKKHRAEADILTASKSLRRERTVRRFIIPAGSLVYYGTNGDICSDWICFPHTITSAVKAWRSRRLKE